VTEILMIAAKATTSIAIRFAVIAWPHKEPEVSALCDRLKTPNEVRELALLACRNRIALRAAPLASPGALLELLKRSDAFRRPERFAELLEVARLASPGLDMAKVQRALASASSVDAGAIAAEAPSPAEIPLLIDQARERAIARSA
jgi:tRNA nucleotidyltransferase (CCA-adding enzyme)